MFSKDHIDIRRDWIQEAMAEILVSKDGQNKHLEKKKSKNCFSSGTQFSFGLFFPLMMLTATLLSPLQ